MIRAALEGAVRRAVSGREVAVAFSGGLDSGLLAHYAKRHAESVMLYAVGAEGSHDVAAAECAAVMLELPMEAIILDEDSALDILERMIRMTGTDNPLTLAFEVPLFAVCGKCCESHVLTGQGADELFGGYSKYAGLGPAEFEVLRKEGLGRLKSVTLAHEDAVALAFGKTLHRPYTDSELVSVVDTMDAADLMPRGALRKETLRKVAEEENLSFLAAKPKKAAQYGSGFTDLMESVCRRRGLRYSELVAEIASRGRRILYHTNRLRRIWRAIRRSDGCMEGRCTA